MYGWWKNGYPEYFAKVINSANWIGIDVEIEGEVLDLARCNVKEFRRTLNMRKGYLLREFSVITPSGKEVKVSAQRFCSIVDDQAGAIRYAITPVNFGGEVSVTPYVDFDVANEDSNYGEKFWSEVTKSVQGKEGWIEAKTDKLDFHVAVGMNYSLEVGNDIIEAPAQSKEKNKYLASTSSVYVPQGEELVCKKICCYY